jgi:hypothetical protein
MTHARRTTHPKKTARRERAADRFSINPLKYRTSKQYAQAKEVECMALGLSLGAYIPAG